MCKGVSSKTAYILDAGPCINSLVIIDVLLALWRSGPALLQNVIGQVTRQLAT
jgi:hypothetical protein